uniref:Tubulin epsilon and delta complex protein 1 domain-containing protein n=1 Tax=Poecilia formosa TaxID=48698 RepID=A0A096LV04_POEFO
MQRSKAAGSVEVRRVIGALCRLLAGLGVGPVPTPDAFRRAKFGGVPEVSSTRFCLCFRSVRLVPANNIADPVYPETRAKTVQSSRTTEPAAVLLNGFSLHDRQLLLALGWLLAQGVLEKLLAGQVAKLDRTLLATGPATTRTRALEPAGLDSVLLRTLQWLMGRLRHQGRTLLSTVGGRTRALHDVLSTSQLCSAAPPAGQSFAALTEVCVKDSVCIQQLCDVLEAYLSWRRVEDVFWAWMDSVVDRRHTGPHATMSSRELGMCHHGNQGLAQLEQLLMRLPIAQVHSVKVSTP